MIAGDTKRREYSISGANFLDADPPKASWAALGQITQEDLAQRAIGFNCLNYNKDPEGALYRHYMPEKSYLDEHCADGVRFEIMFPSCWNGKDASSPNHKSHVAYPDTVMDGNCPKGFDVKLPGLMYETIWATNAFAGVPGEFVASNGDVQGASVGSSTLVLYANDIDSRFRLSCRLHQRLGLQLSSVGC